MTTFALSSHRKRVLSAKAEVVPVQGSEDAGPEPPGGPPPPAPLSAPTPDEEDDDDDDDNDDTGDSGSGVYDVTGTRSSSSSVETDQKVEVADTPLTRKQQLDLWLQQLCDEGLDVLKVPVSRWGKVRQTRGECMPGKLGVQPTRLVLFISLPQTSCSIVRRAGSRARAVNHPCQ